MFLSKILFCFNMTYSWWSVFLALVLIFIAYGVYNVKKWQSYWNKRGVKQIPPRFFFGNTEILFRTKAQAYLVEDLYRKFPETRYNGIYQFLQPTLILKDLDLITQVTKKDFKHFRDRPSFVSPEVDPFWGRTLFASEGDYWHDLRTTLSPAFTANKLKILYTLIDQCIMQYIEYFKKNLSDVIELEMKDTLRRFTNDVIASTSFGLNPNSLIDKNDRFYSMGQQATDFGGFKVMSFFMNDISPTLNKLLGVKMISSKVADYFSEIIKDNVDARKEQVIKRLDMIDLLLKKQNEVEQIQLSDSDSELEGVDISRRREITLDDIISQAFIFYFAGFETASTFLVFAFYELLANPDVQTKLREEIDSVEGEITQEKITRLRYLNQVVTETLRKWPAATLAERKVTIPYTIPAKTPEKTPLYLEEGVVIWLPIFAIHRDPKYYPDPERFDPERFNELNKVRSSKAYMPFGQGPRNCIGSRFALLEGKMFIFHMLKNFEIVPIEKSQIPVVLDKEQPTPTPAGGLWLGLKKRI